MSRDKRRQLSPMQQRIMELIANGLGPGEVAVKLKRKGTTISTQLDRARKKLGAKSTIHAAVTWALMRAYSDAEYRSWIQK